MFVNVGGAHLVESSQGVKETCRNAICVHTYSTAVVVEQLINHSFARAASEKIVRSTVERAHNEKWQTRARHHLISRSFPVHCNVTGTYFTCAFYLLYIQVILWSQSS